MGYQIPAMTMIPTPISLKAATTWSLQLLISLLPRWLRKDQSLSTKKLHPTSYLDALRGYAALCVVLNHRFPWERHWFFNLPVINIIKSGKAMVMVFFVISGFVLSQSLLSCARNREYARFFGRLTSATFRRYLRLFLPVFAVTFVAMLLVFFFDLRAPFAPKPMPSFFDQLQDWVVDCTRVGNPFLITGFYKSPGSAFANSKYVYILWTIPVEYCGSMVVYAFCTASAKMTPRNRMSVCAILIGICYVWKALYAALFLMGVFLAELSLERASSQSPTTTLPPPSPSPPSSEKPTRDSTNLTTASKTLYSLCAFTAIFLLSRNDGPFPADKTVWYPPWPLLNSLTPLRYRDELESSFYPSFGAFLLVFALDAYPTLQKPLEWRFSQYLGEISFGVYVTQMMVLCVDDAVVRPWRRAVGDGVVARGLEFAVCFPLLFWAAEVFGKFDGRAVRFGRWLEGKLFMT